MAPNPSRPLDPAGGGSSSTRADSAAERSAGTASTSQSEAPRRSLRPTTKSDYVNPVAPAPPAPLPANKRKAAPATEPDDGAKQPKRTPRSRLSDDDIEALTLKLNNTLAEMKAEKKRKSGKNEPFSPEEREALFDKAQECLKEFVEAHGLEWTPINLPTNWKWSVRGERRAFKLLMGHFETHELNLYGRGFTLFSVVHPHISAQLQLNFGLTSGYFQQLSSSISTQFQLNFSSFTSAYLQQLNVSLTSA